jgi:hypothetical protein
MDMSSYITLIESYLTRQISSAEFESKYLRLFKNEKRIPPAQIYELLNRLFTDVDAFCSNPSFRNRSSIDENELRECANRAFQELKRLRGEET